MIPKGARERMRHNRRQAFGPGLAAFLAWCYVIGLGLLIGAMFALAM